MFFKPNAKKLLAALENRPSMEDYRRIRSDLRSLGTDHPAELLNLLNDENANTIGTAISKSGEKGLRLLFNIINDRDNPLRLAALRALWEFEEAAARRLEVLEGLIDDPEPEIREHAVHAIARMGESALPAGHKLVRVALEGSEKERTSAFYGLREMRYDPAILQEVCREVIYSGASASVKHAAIDCLKKSGIDPTPFLNGILDYLETEAAERSGFFTSELAILSECEFPTEDLRLRAARTIENLLRSEPAHFANFLTTLWRIDPGNDVVLSTIEEMLRGDDSDLESACDAICELREHGAPFVPLLIEKLQQHQDYWDFCWAAVDALNRIGPAAVAAKPILEQMLQHPSGLVQARAERAIASIEGRPIPEDDDDADAK